MFITDINKTKDEKLRASIESELAKNGGYCPCRAVRNDDTKCVCKEFREMIKNKESGTCHCGLYEITCNNEN